MSSELDKIEHYYEEGARLWDVNPELVISRQFYELWEESQKPVPFAVPGGAVAIAGQGFDLVDDRDRIGYFVWNESEMGASLVVEGAGAIQTFLLFFADGNPSIEETPPAFHQNAELSAGERLEVIYDVIAQVRRSIPSANILDLTRKQYLAALEDLAGHYDRPCLAAMKRLPQMFVKRLLQRAAEDMAVDEISDQLFLPLDGHYAAAGQASASTDPARDSGSPSAAFRIPSRTAWTIRRDLRFMVDAGRLAAENESTCVLDLAAAEVLEASPAGELTLRLEVEADLSLSEGEDMQVFCRGEREPVAMLRLVMCDGTTVYGRLTGAGPDSADLLGKGLVARSRRSPSRFLALALDHLVCALERDAGSAAPALTAVLGAVEAPFQHGCNGRVPGQLDESQARAWRCAVNPENPVALIQGPPGTGKTSVLEKVLRELCRQGLRVLVTAPSNTAVDNICRRVQDLPLLRFGNRRESIANDVAAASWADDIGNVRRFAARRQSLNGGGIYAGTHVGVLRDEIIQSDLAKNGLFDVMVFDEAGMTSLNKFLLCVAMARRVVLFGDHHQLPPFPLPTEVLASLEEKYGPIPRTLWATVKKSALEWLADDRQFPVVLMQRSYRCQNPRLMRFASTLFYDARVKTSQAADYYCLSYEERQRRYPPSTLRLYRTSSLPAALRQERLVLEGRRPGLENPAEAAVCAMVFYDLLRRYPLDEITMIAPYRRQVQRLRQGLDFDRARSLLAGRQTLDETAWQNFLRSRIATVDSFQGGESDAVVITYVRSNQAAGIGFVDDPNRVNVAHTRCRREMVVIGDMACLKRQAKSRIFERMERGFERDGEVVEVTAAMLEEWAC